VSGPVTLPIRKACAWSRSRRRTRCLPRRSRRFRRHRHLRRGRRRLARRRRGDPQAQEARQGGETDAEAHPNPDILATIAGRRQASAPRHRLCRRDRESDRSTPPPSAAPRAQTGSSPTTCGRGRAPWAATRRKFI
jgi:hypothetical protein